MEIARTGGDHADLPSRHGPAWWFVLLIGLIAAVTATLAVVVPDTLARVVLLAICAAHVAALHAGLTWFTAHTGGVTRRTALASRTWGWGEISTGTATEVDRVYLDPHLLPHVVSTVACHVHGLDGRVLFRIGLPVRRRGHLLRLIRRESRRHREREAARAAAPPTGN
jgi:hypothetical protein